ncbi:hypothetical protein FB451DRAFT_486214 [Mycena latifolia]|nr:hypothetical protein FB451DRAFT_486214 [Mycena latifolia]
MVFLNSVEGIPTRDRPSVRAGSGSVKGKGKGKGRAKAPADDELSDLDSDARWSPPPPDSSLSIPGELILAREKKNSTVHWPAKLLGYLPPETRKGTAHYHVQWMDNTVTKPGTEIERDMFYVYEDDGFGTCKLGPFESVFQEVVNDDDADDDTDKPGGARRRRSPSPEPCDPPPPSGDAFADLGLHEQFVYTKPVLQAILRDEYPPARAVHTQFIGGGQGRNAVAKEAGERGQMDPRDVEQFHKYLTEWVMRPPDMGMGGRGNDDADAKQLGGGADEEEIGAEAPKADDIAGAEGNTETPEIAETSLKDVDIPPTTNETLPVPSEEQMRDLEANEDPALHETLCAPASPTATVLDDGASSPPLPPPSSSFSISADNDVLMEEEPEEEADAPRAVVPADVSDDDIERAFDTSSTLSEASDVSDLVPRAKPPRQVGCDAYEGLSTVEKMDYCLNVLLPELLIQIFLWRTGKRTAVALQSEEEEKRLHVLGEEEKRRTDWVFDIKRMRAQKEREINKTVKVVGGTASRPKKVFAR